MARPIDFFAPSYDGGVAWWIPSLDGLDPAARELFEGYSSVAPGEVICHIERIRDKAFAVAKYPCIGEFQFVELRFSKLPFYGDILERVKQGQQLLDLGCCMGQDIRKLVWDGAPSENLHGSDLRPEFFDLGYELFRDATSLKSRFVAADVFAETSDLDSLENSIDIVNASFIFHLFDWDQQKRVAHRILKTLRKQKGSMVTGRQIGNFPRGDGYHRPGWGDLYRHDPESFKRLWDDVAAETGTKFKVEARFDESDAWVHANPVRWQPRASKPLIYAVTIE